MADIDLAISMSAPKELAKPVWAQNEAADAWAIREKNYDTAWTKFDIERARWNNSNHKCLMIIKGSISDGVRGAIPECATATEYLAKVKSQFIGSSKAYAATLTEQLVTKKYTGGGIREHSRNEPHGKQAQNNKHALIRSIHCSVGVQVSSQEIFNFSCQLQHLD